MTKAVSLSRPEGITHVAGIGGVGMSAIAQALVDHGARVTGSDRLADHGDLTPTLRALAGQGVSIFPQDGSGLSPETTTLVVSTAIEADNPDILAAKRLGIRVIHRSVALAELVEGRRLIAVAGTSGKSTTTALLGWILSEGGISPTIVNGAPIVGWDDGGRRVGSVLEGDGPWCVIEADESDRSFLRYHPEHAIITNQSADHFDADETRRLFADFSALVTGRIVSDPIPADDIVSSRGREGTFLFHGREMTVPLPGRYNICNAWQAANLASLIGLDDETIGRALASFPGVERRMQRIGHTAFGALVLDDYGHNPAKLGAAMGVLREAFPRMAVLWRPHGYTPLRKMLEALADTFAAHLRPGDLLLLPPVYDAGGTTSRTINSDALRDAIAARCDRDVRLVATLDEARPILASFGDAGSAILVCGARDPGLPRLAKSLL